MWLAAVLRVVEIVHGDPGPLVGPPAEVSGRALHHSVLVNWRQLAQGAPRAVAMDTQG